MAFAQREEKIKLMSNIKELITLSNTDFSHLDDALLSCIKFGIDKIGFEAGVISKANTNDFEILHIINTNKSITNNRLIPLWNTLLKKVLEVKSTIIIRNVEDIIFYNLPAYLIFDIENIISVPIIVNKKIFGSLTFCTTSRNNYYSNNSIDLTESLAQLIGKILKEENNKIELKAKSDHLQQFNNDLKAFAKIGATHYANFSENLMAYINFGKEITGFENAFIGEVEDDIYTIIEDSITTAKFKTGDVFMLCDTLCKEAIDNRATKAYGNLKNSKYYNVLGRVAFKSTASIIVPLRIDNNIIGVLRFCSLREHEENFKFHYFITIVEQIAERISELIRRNRINKELNKEKLLLKMGAEVFEMASYSRALQNNVVDVTPAFSQIFDFEFEKDRDNLHNNELISILDEKVIEEDKKWFYKNIKKIKVNNTKPFEYRIRTRDRKIKWLRHQLQYNKEQSCILGVVQDITALKKVQEKLQIKNIELEQFAYATAHDLQEPLRTINAYSKILTETCAEKLDDNDKKYFTYLANASKRMKEQIDGLLNHSRIGRQNLMELVDMNNLLNDVLVDLKCSIDSANAVLIIRDLPDIFGYQTELRLMLLNLISNALKFRKLDKGPIIEIGYTEAKLDYWTFYVKDNGIGIAKQNLEKVFKLFTRLNKREEFDGTGIGLAHCKKIANLHNGQICVQSELGEGSIFNFTIKK